MLPYGTEPGHLAVVQDLAGEGPAMKAYAANNDKVLARIIRNDLKGEVSADVLSKVHDMADLEEAMAISGRFELAYMATDDLDARIEAARELRLGATMEP